MLLSILTLSLPKQPVDLFIGAADDQFTASSSPLSVQSEHVHGPAAPTSAPSSLTLFITEIADPNDNRFHLQAVLGARYS